jgi:hypothetical protein
VCLVLAETPLRYAGQASDLTLGDAMSAQNRDHRAEITPLTCVEHVLARADALHHFPEGRDVHRHGVLPVPLVARLSWMVTVSQLHMKRHGGIGCRVRPPRDAVSTMSFLRSSEPSQGIRCLEDITTLRTTSSPSRRSPSVTRAHAVVVGVLAPAATSSPEPTSASAAGTSAAAGSASSWPRRGPGSCHAARQSSARDRRPDRTWRTPRFALTRWSPS